MTVFLPVAVAPFILPNLRDNGQMAVSLVRPTDHRALQIKGVWLGERRTDQADRAFVDRYRVALTEELAAGARRPPSGDVEPSCFTRTTTACSSTGST